MTKIQELLVHTLLWNVLENVSIRKWLSKKCHLGPIVTGCHVPPLVALPPPHHQKPFLALTPTAALHPKLSVETPGQRIVKQKELSMSKDPLSSTYSIEVDEEKGKWPAGRKACVFNLFLFCHYYGYHQIHS